MANVALEITGKYDDTLTMPPQEGSGFDPVIVKPWDGVESAAGLADRATRIAKRACPLGISACDGRIEVERSGGRVKEANLICSGDICPIDYGVPEGFEPSSQTETRLRQLDSVRPNLQRKATVGDLILGLSGFEVHVEVIQDPKDKKDDKK